MFLRTSTYMVSYVRFRTPLISQPKPLCNYIHLYVASICVSASAIVNNYYIHVIKMIIMLRGKDITITC